MKKTIRKIVLLLAVISLTVNMTGCGGLKTDNAVDIAGPSEWNFDSTQSNGKAIEGESKFSGTYYEDYGINPFTKVSEDSQSTFALDVDTASYTKVRNYIEQGVLPPKESVRVEEFINYFKRQYTPPKNDTFSIYTEVAPSFSKKGYHVMEVGIQGKEVSISEKKDSVLTFVIDVSGSMNMENRLGLVKQSLNILVDQLGENDSIGIVVYGTDGRTLLEHTSADNKKLIKKKINQLEPEGTTNASEGLRLGYMMADKNFRKNANNRVILCTDGVANQGLTDAEEILKTIEDFSAKGVTLSSIGFGMNNYNDIFLEKLANKGDGNYFYIDTFDEAKKIFTNELTSVLQVIAKDAKAQVEFDKSSVEEYRLIGYENRNIEDKDFENDKIDAGEIGAGHAVTALYELKLKEDAKDDLAVVKLHYKDPDTDKSYEISKTVKTSDIKKDFYSATPRFRFINMVSQFAENLRNSEYGSLSIKQIYDYLKDEESKLVVKDEDREFIELVGKAYNINSNELNKLDELRE